MDFVRLTPEQRQAMEQDGFLVVRAALDRETVARAIDAVDRLAYSFLNKPVVLDRPEYNQLDLRPGLVREEALFELVANSSTVPLVVQMMGPNIHLHSTAIIAKRPRIRAYCLFDAGGIAIFGWLAIWETRGCRGSESKSAIVLRIFPRLSAG